MNCKNCIHYCVCDYDDIGTRANYCSFYEESRPHGEWHTTPNPNHSPFDSTSAVIYMCSQCAYSNGDRIAATWNFCPNCGADIRLKEGEVK